MTEYAKIMAVAVVLLAVVVYLASRVTGRGRSRRRRGGVGSAAMGTVYDLLNEDKRRAIEIIVEEKAEERRPEYPDGNLPDLEDPRAVQRPRAPSSHAR
jgi:hypothetical protein